MLISDFNYQLPSELIADRPLDNRKDSRLITVERNSGEIHHKKFTQVIDYLQKGDCLVLNNTKVIPARLTGSVEDSGSKIEILLIRKTENSNDSWEVIAKPAKKLKPGVKLFFCNRKLTGEVAEKPINGKSIIKFNSNGLFDEIIEKFGKMPLPPYILKKRNLKQNFDSIDKERYQTIFAKIKGSIAAPTAGLHFTEDILDSIKSKGVNIVEITLHVGIGTFKPVRVEDVEEHDMDKEYFEISKEVIDIINNTKRKGNKIIGVGSTVTRALETVYKTGTVPLFPKEKRVPNEAGTQRSWVGCPYSGWADIFIYPGFKFNVVDKLITNFHLPGSTPLLLVCAFAGKDLIFYAYNEAIKNNYRFLSYGDAMLII